MKTTQLLVLSTLSLQLLTACNSKNDNFVSNVKQDRSQIRTEHNLESTHREISNQRPDKLVSLIKVAPMGPTYDNDYIEYDTSLDFNVGIYNGVDLSNQGASIIRVSGKHIVIEHNHPQRLLEKFSNRLDIKKIVIEAEVVEINNELNIPGADIEIRSENLIIGTHGKIVTTPSQNLLIPNQFENGSNGQKGGDISLYVEKIDLPNIQAPIFVLSGANGQAGGPGQDGLSGKSVPAIGSNGLIYVTQLKRECNRESGRPVCQTFTTVTGQNNWPTDGSNALKGGLPGAGGDGGNFLSSLNLSSKYITQSSGNIGQIPQKSLGGAAGTPTSSRHSINGKNISRETRKGQDATVSVESIKNGSEGKFVVNDKMSEWVTSTVLSMMNEYAKDQYLANDFNNSKLSFLKISKLISKSSNSNDFSKEQLAVSTSLNQLANHLDYYGNSATWSPTLSLESTVDSFTMNKKHLLKTLYLTYWLKNTKESVQEKYSGLSDLAKIKYESITKYQIELNSITTMIPKIRTSIQEYASKEKDLKDKIIQTELEIKRQATNELEPSGLLKVIRSIGAIATVIPAGQPALGLIGNGLATLSNAIESDSPVSEILSSAPGIYDSLSTKVFEKSAKDWNQKWSALDFSELDRRETTREKLDYANSVIKFSAPIVTELNKQIGFLSNREVPKNELNRRIDEIKKSHPQFYSLIDLLKQTLFAKEQLAAQVKFFQQKWTNASIELSGELVEYVKIKRAQETLDQGSNLVFDNTITQIENNTKRKLNLYAYYLTKAYEYRFLKSYTKSLSLNSMNDTFRELVEANNGTYLSANEFRSVTSSYDNILFDIKEKITNDVRDNNAINDDRIYLELNSNELYHLNKNGSVEVSILDDRIFSNNQTNIRLNSINLSDVRLASGKNVEITIERSGDHYIENQDMMYAFESNKKNSKWMFKQDRDTDTFYPLEVSNHNTTLLRELFDISTSNVFMRPGAKAIYKISLNKKISRAIVDRLEIKFDCDLQVSQ